MSLAPALPTDAPRPPPTADQKRRWAGPLFIVGMPRSGTKLLRALLEQHPRIRIPDIETDFLPFLVQWVRRYGEPRSKSEFLRLFARLRRTTYFTLRRIPERFEWENWRTCCDGRFDAAGLFEGFIRHETGVSCGSDLIWGDKSPSYIRHVPLLLKYFPDARVVHIVRDVRDHCASIRRAWNKDVRRAAFQWGRDVAQAHEDCLADPSRCIEVKYEDLLLHPEREMRRLSGFLGVDYSQEMTRLNRSVENLGDATGRMEIVRDNFQKFMTRLTRREITAIESLSLGTMRLLGYEPVYARRQRQLGPITLRCLRLKDGINLVRSQSRKRGFLKALRFHASHSLVTRAHV